MRITKNIEEISIPKNILMNNNIKKKRPDKRQILYNYKINNK